MTADPAAAEAEERAAGCVAFAVIHTSADVTEARIVEADVRLNFLWHFPGRCLNKGDYRSPAIVPAVNHVYVACFAATAAMLGKA